MKRTGDISMRGNVKYTVMFLTGFVLLGIVQTMLAGHFLGTELDNKRALNMVTFPFQILQVCFLFLAISYSGKHLFDRDSLWYSEKSAFHPIFVSARTFDSKLYFSIFLVNTFLALSLDLYTKTYPKYYFWIFNNLIILSFTPIISHWIGIFMKKLEIAIENIRIVFDEEEEYEKYKNTTKKSIFSKNEVILIFLILAALRIIEMIFPAHTWVATGGYVYPLVPLWWSLVVIPLWNLVYAVLVSISYTYCQFSRSLFQLTRKENIKVYLFHPDGFSGLKGIVDLVYWISSRLLLIVAIGSFLWYITIRYFPQNFSFTGLIYLIIVIDVFSLLVLMIPLIPIRRLIRKKKEQEKGIILNKIKEKEDIITKESRSDISRDLDDLRSLFTILDKIDSVNEWLIGREIKFNLGMKILLGFNPLFFELLERVL